jgi:F-type H+-transporting ATPase subunit epsilon
MADLPSSLKLEIATPLGMALSVQTDSVQVPSVEGEFGVLPGHVPLLAALKPGILTYREGGQFHQAAVGAGYAEATADHVRLISEFFLRKEQIDVEDARKDLAAAEAQLKSVAGTIEDVAYQEAKTAYDWAIARLTLAGGANN